MDTTQAHQEMDELTRQEISSLRELIKTNDRRYIDRFEASQEALTVALEASNKRLDGMNEFRAALTDQAARMVTREEWDLNRVNVVDRIEQYRETFDTKLSAEIGPMANKLDVLGKPNWPLLASFMSVVFALIAGGWLVIGLKIDAAISPMTQTISAMKVVEATTDAQLHQIQTVQQSRSQLVADVSNLRTNVNSMYDSVQIMKEQQTKNSAALVEIETQFCGQDNLRSQIHASDLRWFAMLWHKVFGQELPIGNAFYGKVGRCGGDKY
jgi:hypothetical protein